MSQTPIPTPPLPPKALWMLAAWRWDWTTELVPYVSQKSADWRWDHKSMLDGLRQLAELSLAHHGHLVDMDTGIPHGSSYTLTTKGDELRRELFPSFYSKEGNPLCLD